LEIGANCKLAALRSYGLQKKIPNGSNPAYEGNGKTLLKTINRQSLARKDDEVLR
jgi:hypothetical protein